MPDGILRVTGQAASGNLRLAQKIENVSRYAGRPLTLAADAPKLWHEARASMDGLKALKNPTVSKLLGHSGLSRGMRLKGRLGLLSAFGSYAVPAVAHTLANALAGAAVAVVR